MQPMGVAAKLMQELQRICTLIQEVEDRLNSLPMKARFSWSAPTHGMTIVFLRGNSGCPPEGGKFVLTCYGRAIVELPTEEKIRVATHILAFELEYYKHLEHLLEQAEAVGS